MTGHEFGESLEQLVVGRRDVIARLEGMLQQTLFDSRAYLRPGVLKRLASQEADAFFVYLVEQDRTAVEQRGKHLCEAGVGDQALLRFGSELRQFCETCLGEGQCRQALPLVEDYHRHLLQGYMRALEATILEEQERIRSALQHTLHRYTLQIETAAQVARTTISTLDLGELLATTVDLIRERFGLDYVGIYLVDRIGPYLVLRAASGAAGRRRLAAGHKLPIPGTSTVARSIVNREPIVTSPAGGGQGASPDDSRLSRTQSEVALPLISRDLVIGALTVQSCRPGAFSSQDIPGFQIMADQLANAIENARLYADARQRADELALAYDQLKELDRLKDQFMQNVSHELRTPLTMIQGYAELMASGEMGAVDSEQQEAIQVIIRYSQALTELVSDIMAILEATGTSLSVVPVALDELVRASLITFQRLAEEQDIALEAHTEDKGGKAPVLAQPDHLRRIFENLLSNAMKFTPRHGTVEVRLQYEGPWARLEVSDTGIGIAPEAQSRVFERFFQVDGSDRRRFGGTGLGLALVKELVENYGGQVSVYSPGIGRGTTFTIVLPTMADTVAVA